MAHKTLSIAVAQIPFYVGDIEANCEAIRIAHKKAAKLNADLVLFPELIVTGYPVEDLTFKPVFLDKVEEHIHKLADYTKNGGPALLVSSPWREEGKCYNAIFLLDKGEIVAKRFKHSLPDYTVFDESRTFDAGPLPEPVMFKGFKLGLPICEDNWVEGPCEFSKQQGAEIFLAANGSPFAENMPDRRKNTMCANAKRFHVPVIYSNNIGGQDELVFDGCSFGVNPNGEITFAMGMDEEIRLIHARRTSRGIELDKGVITPRPSELEYIWRVCMRGLRDYVYKNGFSQVVLGLSGGIDSALVAAIAADALGPNAVRTIMLPYNYTSDDSIEDARECATNLKVSHEVISIKEAVDGFLNILHRHERLKNPNTGTTQQNLQSRCRGTLLMALSNDTGALLLTTGNKSECAVGYATLYGDMCGGFNPIRDIYKTDVFRLANWRNENIPLNSKCPELNVIPSRIITKAPTAELAPNQRDEDNLPPYHVLDEILRHLIDEDGAIDALVARGFARDLVKQVEKLVYLGEFKRRQAAPGVRISTKPFNTGRRYPITHAFRDN